MDMMLKRLILPRIIPELQILHSWTEIFDQKRFFDDFSTAKIGEGQLLLRPFSLPHHEATVGGIMSGAFHTGSDQPVDLQIAMYV